MLTFPGLADGTGGAAGCLATLSLLGGTGASLVVGRDRSSSDDSPGDIGLSSL